MKRALGTAILLSASLALAGCNSPKPAMVNKTPIAETIMDSGVKEAKKPKRKLALVPKKVETEPAGAPASQAPDTSEKEEKPKWAPLPIIETKRPGYNPTKDQRPLYPVDKNGERLDKKEAGKKNAEYDLSDFKPREPPKPKYNPWEDQRPLYPVDENGERLDKKKTAPKE